MEFYAGANTRYGFVSIFDECFKDIARIFILKGSSGCGKSTFMRRVAKKAYESGLTVDIIRCSADPDSLDGVIVHELGVAVADGTSPHVMDVKYPCVRESIINLGEFWDERSLLSKREEIISLADKKSEHYKNAYRCLAALGSAEEVRKGLITEAVVKEKLDETVFSVADKAFGATGGEKKLFSSAFTANGVRTLPTFGDADILYRVSGYASFYLIASLYGLARERGTEMIASLSTLDPSVPDSVYFPSGKVLVTMLESPPISSAREEKHISCSKFTDSDLLNARRVRLRGLDRLINELSSEAKSELAFARARHNELEGIYIPAMDFESLDEYTNAFIKRLFGE